MLLEEVTEAITSKSVSIGVESIVPWLGDRMTSCCGIRIAQADTQKLSGIVRDRMMALSIKDPLTYFQLVGSRSEEGGEEWDQLLADFMNGETFFFRDSGQFTLLKEQILPSLIQRRKAKRSLRILSAGCSTGEETYSLAILVDQLISERQDWEIDILGTDINVRSIRMARQGIYGSWAFRKAEAAYQQQYFQQKGSQWEVNKSIRQMVTFRKGNIFANTYSLLPLGLYDLDLIVCRNVFLYFHTDAIKQVVNNLSEALSSDGYFLTGHGELPKGATGTLQAKVFPDSVIYQRPQTMCAVSHQRSLQDCEC